MPLGKGGRPEKLNPMPSPYPLTPVPCRSSHTSVSGTRAKTWHGTACRGTPTTRHTAGTHSASSAMSATWTMMSCSSTYVETTISATSVTQMGPRTTTGRCGAAWDGP